MKINNIFNNITEQSILKTSRTKPLVDAIKNRYPISFIYTGPQTPKKDSVKPGKRIKAEAVALGLSKKGNLIIRAYVQPPSVSKKGFNKHGWRTFMVSRMGNIQIHQNETFDTKKQLYRDGDDGSMTVTYVTSLWNTAPKIKKQIKKVVSPVSPTSKKPDVTPKPNIPTPETDKVTNDIPKKTKPEPIVKPDTNKTTEIPTKTNLEPVVKSDIPKKTKPEPIVKPESNDDSDKIKNDNEPPIQVQETLKRIKTLLFY